MSVLLAAGIGAVASGLTTLYNNYQTKKQSESNYELNELAAENAYERDLEMWNKNNAYNSAESQVSRLKEANLNSALMYSGSGSYGSGTSSSSSQAQGSGSSGQSAIPADNPTVALQAAVAQKQIEKTDADIANIEADTANKTANTANTEQQTANLAQALKSMQQDYEYKTLDYPLQLSLTTLAIEFSKLQNTGQDISNDIADVNLSIADNSKEISDATKSSTVDYAKAEASLAKLQLAFSGATFDTRVDREYNETEKTSHSINKLIAETFNVSTMTSKELKAIDMITEQLNNLKLQGDILTAEKKYVYWQQVIEMLAKMNIKAPDVKVHL